MREGEAEETYATVPLTRNTLHQHNTITPLIPMVEMHRVRASSAPPRAVSSAVASHSFSAVQQYRQGVSEWWQYRDWVHDSIDAHPYHHVHPCLASSTQSLAFRFPQQPSSSTSSSSSSSPKPVTAAAAAATSDVGLVLFPEPTRPILSRQRCRACQPHR